MSHVPARSSSPDGHYTEITESIFLTRILRQIRLRHLFIQKYAKLHLRV